jgi:hypothetical protein
MVRDLQSDNRRMMSYIIITALIAFTTSSCLNGKFKQSETCENYLSIVQTEWKRSETGVYRYDNHPQYWPPFANFFDGKCLEGTSKKAIIDLLGTPSKSFFLVNQEIIIYCTDEKCLYGGLDSNRGLTVVLTNGKVIEAYHNPLETQYDRLQVD